MDLGGNIRFDDDVPTVNVAKGVETGILLTTQDAQTIGAATDTDVTTANFAGVFTNTPVYGADGAGSTVMSYNLALVGAPGTDSNLDSNGVQINLFDVGGVITGSTSTDLAGVNAGNTIFSIGVNASGVVTLTQFAEIDHALEGTTTAPFDDQFAILGNGLVNLTGSALITDGDGDTATDSEVIDLGGNIRFADDGPSVTGATASIQVEEDELLTGITDGDAFTQAATFTAAQLAALVNPGADGPVTFSLNTTLTGNVQTTASVNVTSKNVQVAFGTNAGDVVGFVNLGGGAGFDMGTDREVFRLEDNADGTFTFTLKDQIDHLPLATGGGDAETISLKLTGAFVGSDTDNDTVTLGANAVEVIVENDVPVATNDGNFVLAIASDTATGNVITGASSDGIGGADTVGADLSGIISAISSDGKGTNGTVGSSLAGLYGNLVLNADGSYTYTRTSTVFVGGDDVFTYTLRDADGDAATAKLTITSDVQGINGGHFDLDTYNDTGATGVNNSNGHIHEYSGDYGNTINTFGLEDGTPSNLQNITDEISPSGGQVFRLIVVNGTRNAGANIEINGQVYDAYNYGDVKTSTAQGEVGNGEMMQLYTLDPAVAAANSGNVKLLTSFSIYFPEELIVEGGLRGSVTGDVKSNLLSTDGEWRTGALSTWAVEVLRNTTVPDVAGTFEVSAATDGYNLVRGTINSGDANVLAGVIKGITTEAGGTFAAGDGILYETSSFWHWGGPSGTDYGNLTTVEWNAAVAGSGGHIPAGTPFPDPLAPGFLDGFKDIFVIGTTGNDLKTYSIDPTYHTIIQGDPTAGPAGIGSDTLVLNQSAAINLSLTQDQDISSSKVTVTGFENVDASGSSGVVNLNGSSGVNVLKGGSANDTITGGAGSDTLTGNAGADTFVINSANSPAVIGGAGNAGTVTGYDVVTDFDTASDILNLQGTAAAVANTAGTNGADSVLTIVGATIKSHAITNGIITFDDNNTYSAALSLTSLAHVAAVVDYLNGNDLGNAGATVAFVANISGTDHTYVYEQVATAQSIANDILVDLNGVALTNLTSLIPAHVTPVVLDMNGNGLEFTSLADSHARFDFDGDGTLEKSAWVGGGDAFLVYDHNGDRAVNDGSEIVFTQYHPDAKTDLDGLRLAFDTNHDGKLDAADADFEKFGVWQDADGDGVTDSGEYHSLTEAGIASIGLTSDGHSYSAADGSVLVSGEGTFTYADGSIGKLGDVSLAVVPDGDSHQSATLPLDELIDADVTVDHLLPSAPVEAKTDAQLLAGNGVTRLDATASTPDESHTDAPADTSAAPTHDAHMEALAATPIDDAKVVSVPENVAPVEDAIHAVA